MSRTALGVLLGLAALLAASLAFLQWRGGSAGTASSGVGVTLLRFEPDSVRAVTIEAPDAPRRTVVRGGPTGWALKSSTAAGEPGWPIIPSYAERLLRALGGLTAATDDDAEPAVIGRAFTVTLDIGAVAAPGPRPSVRIAADGLGGLVAAETPEGEAAFVPDAVVAALNDPPAGEWRLRGLLAGLASERVSRLTIGHGSASIELRRLSGRWEMLRPVDVRAEAALVDAVIAALDETAAERFDDVPAAEPTPADITIVAVAETRSIDASTGEAVTRAERRTISLRPDAAGGDTAWIAEFPDAIATLTPGALAGLPTDPGAFVARTATGVRPAEVAAVEITAHSESEPRRIERDLEGWSFGGGGAADTRLVDELLAFFCDEPAEVRLGEIGDGFRDAGRVSLLGFDGGALDDLRVGFDRTGRLVVAGSNAVWTYAEGSSPRLLGFDGRSAATGVGEAAVTPPRR